MMLLLLALYPQMTSSPLDRCAHSLRETNRQRRDEQWKAAYARLGQEPPSIPQVDEEYDGRTLAEVNALPFLP